MNRVQQNLATTLLPVHLGRQTETGAWEGLIEVLGSALPAYAQIRQSEEQRKAAEVVADIERMRLAQAAAQAPTAKLSQWLRQYWPHLAIGTAGLVTVALIFGKPK